MNNLKTLASALGAVSILGLAAADTPKAGTSIVNQATVQYTDETGTDREATTNEVILFVQAVYSSTLEGDRARSVAVGGTASFVHTLTNTGNSDNTFCVSAAERTDDSGNFDRYDVYYDANGDGQPGTEEQVLYSSSGGVAGELTLNDGEVGGLIAVGIIPASATSGETYALDLNVTSKNGTGACGTGLPADTGSNADGADGTNRDIATVTADAVLEITKDSEYRPGAVNDLTDDEIDYTITVRNTGVSPANDILISDTLDSATIFDSFGINDGTYSTGPAHLTGTVTAEAATLAPGGELVIRFTVDIDPTLGFAGESLVVENMATVEADLDSAAGREPVIESNTVTNTIDPVYAVTLSDIGGVASPGVNDGADDDTLNDIQLMDVAAPGDVAEFILTVTNNGNAADTFNFTETGRAGWFNGAGLRYLQRDFSTPLLDTTGDGIVDSGPLEPGESLTFMVKAALPFTEPSAPHTLGLVATSTAELSGGAVNASDPTTLAIGAGSVPAVDIANSASATGFNDAGIANADPESAITTTLGSAPGGQVIFDLFIANEGAGPDTFEITAWADAAGTVSLPNGWAVSFEALDGSPVNATPQLQPGAVFAFRARVSSPESATDGTLQSVFFKASSFDTGVSDIKQDAVSISALPAITLTPDQFGQVAACGREDHLHALRNAGGTAEAVTLTTVSQSKLNSDILIPTSASLGEPDAYQSLSLSSVGDPVAILSNGIWAVQSLVTDGAGGVAIPLTVGDETRIMARVIAACDTASGTVDVLILEAETIDMDARSTVTDTTTVASARLDIAKLGALDAGCAGGPDGAFDDARVQAEPGDCVIWQIIVRNAGVEPVCDVRARDVAPSFTQFSGVPLIIQQPSPGTGICNVNGNEFACTLGNSIDVDGDSSDEAFCLRGGEEAEVQFSVSIE